MAEFLVANNSSANPSGYRVGDIVDVREDGWNWAAGELSSVVKRPDLSFPDALKYREEDQEIYVFVHRREAKDRAGRLSLRRDGVEIGAITDRSEGLIKSRTMNVADIGVVKILNRADEELLWEDRDELFARRRWKMVGNVITDKLT